MRCPRCQQETREGQKFCGECGMPLERVAGDTQPVSYADMRRFLTETLEQQTATSEILRVISQSPPRCNRSSMRSCGVVLRSATRPT